MGKYSLENYSTYETFKIRPQPLLKSPDHMRRGQMNYVEFSWEELEMERGSYNLSPMIKAIAQTSNPVLVISPAEPSWVKGSGEECFSSLIRRVGSYLAGDKQLVGAVIPAGRENARIWDAYIDSFDDIPILANLEDSSLIRYLKEKGVVFGLTVTCCEGNWIDCCEAFAGHNLQSIWERRPVVLQVTDSAAGTHISRECLRWHAGFSNLPMDIGYYFTLRRLTYPKNISGKGALPLRFWLVNTGSAPCYKEITLKIQLKQGNTEYELIMNTGKRMWLPGDITHNEIIQLPEMEQGSYKLSAGIFLPNRIPIRLNIQGKERNGFYELGVVEVDTNNRNYLFHAWDDFYPDGYYPLEDPEAPNEII